MARKPSWIRLLVSLVLALQLLASARPAHAETIYVVQPGDNLFRISLRFGVSQAAIMAANDITDPRLIYVGQQLVIPDGAKPVSTAAAQAATPVVAVATATASAVPALPPEAGVYIVQRGDSLYQIALKLGVSQGAIIAVNGLTNPRWITPGQRLVIPGSRIPAASVATPALTTLTPASAAPTQASGVYVVQRGDTLWGLARRFGVSVAEISAANHLASSLISVGQSLVIPGNSEATAPSPAPTAAPAAAVVEATPPATLPPWIPVITPRMRQIYAQSAHPNAFAVVGDCNSEYPLYVGPVAVNLIDLSAYGYLTTTVKRFWPSFLRQSLAAQGSFNAASVMDPAWANPQQCASGESPFACELRISQASIVFIGLGTGDQFTWREFEKNYRVLVEYALNHGVLPVLVTKADALESQEGGAESDYINSVIRRLGQAYEVPVLDLWLAVHDLPNGGLAPEGGHDFHLSSEAIGWHNVATLQTLDAIWHR